MKFCPKCGKTLIEDSVFCLLCGERIDILTAEAGLEVHPDRASWCIADGEMVHRHR